MSLKFLNNGYFAGKVGIGTESPSARLEVFSTTTDKFVRFRADNNEQRFEFYVGASGNASRMSMYNDAATETIRFASAGNSYFNAGNVGVGTTTPSFKLDTRGSVRIINTDENTLYLDTEGAGQQVGVFYRENGASKWEQRVGSNFELYNYGRSSWEFHIQGSTGNLGIGTTTPTARLDVRLSTATGKVAELHNNAGYGVGFTVESDGGVNTINSESNQALAFATNGASNERMRIDIAGNVGIGTTSPGAKLDVSVSTAGDYAALINNTNSTNGYGLLARTASTGTSSYAFAARAGSSDIFVVRADGNVGIGTTSPGYKLDISGSLRATGESTFTNNLLFPDNSRIKLGASPDLEIYHNGSNSYINDIGTGDLYIQASDNMYFQTYGSGKRWITLTENAGVDLFYNDIHKLSTGIVSVGAATTAGGTLIDGWKTTTQANAINDTTIATTAYVNNKIALIPAGLVFQGTWNASTNTPTLTSGSGTTGHFYIVSTDGSTNLDGITDWKVGDWAVFVEQGASDQWEKVDNSSVLDGSGTGQKVTKWDGSGTSNTLTDGPITFSGNNSTFAGDVTATANYSAGNSKIIYKAQRSGGAVAGDWSYDDATTDMSLGTSTAHSFSLKTGNTRALTLNSSQNAIFAGDVTIGSSGASSDKTLNILTGGSKSAVKLMEAGTVYGFSTVYDGAANKFHINRHNNSAAGTPVLSLNRDDNNATFAGDVTATRFNVDSTSNYIDTIGSYLSFKSGGNEMTFGGSTSMYINYRAALGGTPVQWIWNAGTSSSYAKFIIGELDVRSNALFAGNVGIGTTSPGDKLEIGNLTNYTGLTVKGAGASRPAVTFKNATQSLLGAIYGTEGRDIIIETGGNGTTGTVALTLSSAGALKLNTYTAGTLVSDASGNITVSSGGGAGGPYLPLSAGSTKKLTDTLYIQGTNTTNQESVLLRGVASGDGDFLGSIRTANTGGYNQEMRFYTSNANGTTDEDLNLTLKPDQSAAFAGSVLVNGTNVTVANASNPYVYLNDTNAGAAIFQQEGNTTRIGSDSNTQVVLVQNNATAVTIGTNKNVGIGDTSPTSISANTFSLSVNSSRTDLSGAFISKANGTVKHQQYWDSTGYGFNLSANSGNFKFTGGNVGIGTTSPAHKLTVNAPNDTTAVGIDFPSAHFDFSANSTSGYTTSFHMDDTATTIGSDSAGRALKFQTNNTDRLYIKGNTGNVGIGTTSPGVKLHLISADEQLTNFSSSVANQLAYSRISAHSSTSGTTTGAAALELVGQANGSGHGRHAWIGAEGTSSTNFLTKLKFKIRGETNSGYQWAGSSSEAPTIMTLEGDGNVGIGTTSPESKLQVAGGIQMANDTATASAAKVGTMRYRTGTEYVEVTGAEILTNPGFDTDTTWVKGTGWTIANGKASVDNASSTALSQPSFGVTTGKIYNVRIDVSNYTSGSLQLQFGASQVIASISANGEYNYTVTSTITGGTFYLYGVGDCEFSVDNASVIEVEAEDASYADMCMQTGASTYEWVNIVRNTY